MKPRHLLLAIAAAVFGTAHGASPVGISPVVVASKPTPEVRKLPAWRSQARGGGAVARGGKSNIQGYVSVAGGVMAHLVLGTLYCWGNFVTYAPSGLQFFDGLGPEHHIGQTADAIRVMPATMLSMCAGMPLGARFMKKYGPKATSFLGCSLMVAGVALSSMQTRLAAFMLCYSLLAGIGIGFAYSAPMVAGWSWFPDQKGLVNGLVLIGFGAGAFLFNMVGTRLINPGGFPAPFPASVSAAWPTMLQTLAVIYAVTALTGSLLIQAKPAEPTTVATDKKKRAAKPAKAVAAPLATTFSEAIRSKTFWLLWLMILCTATPSLNVANMYKKFAIDSPALQSDMYQSTVGGLAALFNGVGRLFWATLVDKFGFKRPYRVLTMLEVGLMLGMPFAAASRSLFAVVVCLIFFCLGGNFSMFPTVNTLSFGTAHAAEIYSLLFTAFATASIGGAEITRTLVSGLGWNGVFKVMAGFACLSLVLIESL